MTDRYRVTRKRITQSDGPDYEAGDVWEDPPDAVIRAFGDRLERIQDDQDGNEDDGGEEAEGPVDPPFDPGEYTIDELEDALEAGEYSDAEVAALYSAEVEGEDRTGAIDAIDEYLGADQD